MKNRFFYCYQGRQAKLFAFLSLLLSLSLLQLSCDVEENCLDPTTNCFLGAGSIKLIKSTPDVSAGVGTDFKSVTLTFSEELSNIKNFDEKSAYSFSGDGALGFEIKNVKKINDTTVEIEFEGDIAEGPITLDFSKLEDSDGNPLGGKTSISFTNNFRATLTLKSGTITSSVAPTGGNNVTITSSLGAVITSGTSTTITHAGANAIKVEIESSSNYTVNVSTAGVGGTPSVSVTYPTTTTTTTITNFTTSTPDTTNGTTTATTTNSSAATTGEFTTTTGKITITTTGGTITTTGGTITTKSVQIKWSTNLKSASYHMGRDNSCPLAEYNGKTGGDSNRFDLGVAFQEDYPPSGGSSRNNNVNGRRGTGTSAIRTPDVANQETVTTINAHNLLDGTSSTQPSNNDLIICVQKNRQKTKSKEYISKTFSVKRYGSRGA